MSSFTDVVASGIPVLTDGAIETRVMFETPIAMDPDVQVAGLLGDPQGEAALAEIYRSYLDAAASTGVPLVIGTPTFRASLNYTRRAGLGDTEAVRRLNSAAVAFHRQLLDGHSGPPVWVAGVLGPAGDAYLPAEAPSASDAFEYHRPQVDALAEAGVDFLFAATFPAVGEAVGAARAMAQTGLPFVVSWVLGADTRLLDGTPLAEAIRQVDDAAAPTYFSLSCIHPTVAARALGHGGDAVDRINEVKANGSTLSPAELVALDHAESDPPAEFAAAMNVLRRDYRIAVVGGCCGTTDEHMRALGALLAE
ncbi:homocysteine S-methyltransferase family protein [Mycolicibacterium aichiense]|uniref:Homocysteine methyltransferase n=1 Tax=Mycolicibacterium aichiense TaxID=1799 RepID=A0AAD1MCW6_9MYCO|nr:homocysteine S-methyltransferase family protein [Mycolicibacterium aichiense]MCV7020497.1 homocysteine S-methyltransferase family protein [Mycolicibacterium aichiense]BBX08010.1 homocysteine methyltransferase [Mycolicibacterium aichiense]STZ81819.1 homocysteine/selenocysteine methylase [Mycolicibacterium aichiense]